MTRSAMATDDFEHRATAQRFAGWLREVLSELVTHPEGVHVDAQWVATRTLRLRPGTPQQVSSSNALTKSRVGEGINAVSRLRAWRPCVAWAWSTILIKFPELRIPR